MVGFGVKPERSRKSLLGLVKLEVLAGKFLFMKRASSGVRSWGKKEVNVRPTSRYVSFGGKHSHQSHKTP